MNAKTVLSVVIIIYVALAGALVVMSDEECAPGSYAVNSSGTFICVPKLDSKGLNLPFVGIAIAFFSNNTVYVRVTAFDPNGINGTLEILDPNDNLLYSFDLDVPGGSYVEKNVSLPSDYDYDYIVVSGEINGYDIGMYAVPKQEKPLFDVSTLSNLDPRYMYLFMFGVIAPFVGISLRGRPKEGGLGLIALGILYVPIMHVLGLQFPVPEVIGAVSFITGTLLVAANMK